MRQAAGCPQGMCNEDLGQLPALSPPALPQKLFAPELTLRAAALVAGKAALWAGRWWAECSSGLRQRRRAAQRRMAAAGSYDEWAEAAQEVRLGTRIQGRRGQLNRVATLARLSSARWLWCA